MQAYTRGINYGVANRRRNTNNTRLACTGGGHVFTIN
jgi:hypothetical protein